MEYILEQKKLIQKFLFRSGYRWGGTFFKDHMTGDLVVELRRGRHDLVAQLFVNDLEFKIYKKDLQPGKCVVTTIADLSHEWIRYQASSGSKRSKELQEIVEKEKSEILAGLDKRAKTYGDKYSVIDDKDKERIEKLDKASRTIRTKGWM